MLARLPAAVPADESALDSDQKNSSNQWAANQMGAVHDLKGRRGFRTHR